MRAIHECVWLLIRSFISFLGVSVSSVSLSVGRSLPQSLPPTSSIVAVANVTTAGCFYPFFCLALVVPLLMSRDRLTTAVLNLSASFRRSISRSDGLKERGRVRSRRWRQSTGDRDIRVSASGGQYASVYANVVYTVTMNRNTILSINSRE